MTDNAAFPSREAQPPRSHADVSGIIPPMTRHDRLTHSEEHFTASEIVRDTVLGMSDGLTVPFALAAGLTGAIQGSRLIVAAGLAEIAAGTIAMGLGGYLAARSEVEHYRSERAREQTEVNEVPHVEEEEVREVFRAYGLHDDEIEPVVDALRRRPQAWIDFMMRFELGLERPNPRRALTSAVVIGGAYALGGIIPLVPYMLIARASSALWISSAVTLIALVVFGVVKGRFTGVKPARSGLQMALIGAVAAAAAFVIAQAIA